MVPYLIVGLGNPGEAYERTRHNIGFRVVKALARKQQWSFRKAKAWRGVVAEGSVGEKKALLLLPQTYMNSSGEAIQSCSSYCRIPTSQILVVCDDVYLPLGSLRMKMKGGCGGHNGLRSIESHLGTQEYARLRIGVGSQDQEPLADYVLSLFRPDEEQALADPLQRAVSVLECWLLQGAMPAIKIANDPVKELPEDKKSEKYEEK